MAEHQEEKASHLITTVTSVDMAEKMLRTRGNKPGDFIFWKNLDKPDQLQITYLIQDFSPHLKLASGDATNIIAETVYCNYAELHALYGSNSNHCYKKLAQLVENALITVVAFDHDKTLTKYHTHEKFGEQHKIPTIQGTFDYKANLRFPEQADVIRKINSLPNVHLYVISGHPEKSVITNTLDAMFGTARQIVIPDTQVKHHAHKHSTLSQLKQEFEEQRPVTSENKLLLTQLASPTKLKVLKVVQVILINDTETENQLVKQMGGTVIAVDGDTNQHLLELNELFNCELELKPEKITWPTLIEIKETPLSNNPFSFGFNADVSTFTITPPESFNSSQEVFGSSGKLLRSSGENELRRSR